MFFHTIIAGILFSTVVTVLGVSITNEYDQIPGEPAMAIQ